MALFIKKPEVGSRISFTAYGMNKTLLIVGLGNIGQEYDNTRHNVGFMCVDDFARKNDFAPWTNKNDLKCQVTQATIGDQRVILAKPTTFMNLSGEAVQAVSHFYKVSLENIIVIHDELDVDFGQIRLRNGGTSAGHNGIKSVTKHMSESYNRIRVGIGPKPHPEMDSADFVLSKWNAKELESLPKLKREVDAVLSELAYGAPFAAETRSFL